MSSIQDMYELTETRCQPEQAANTSLLSPNQPVGLPGGTAWRCRKRVCRPLGAFGHASRRSKLLPIPLRPGPFGPSSKSGTLATLQKQEHATHHTKAELHTARTCLDTVATAKQEHATHQHSATRHSHGNTAKKQEHASHRPGRTTLLVVGHLRCIIFEVAVQDLN